MFIIQNFIMAAAPILAHLIELYIWVLIIRVLITWVNPDPYNPVVQFLSRVSDPYLYQFRRFIPPLGGIDLSPILAILFLGFCKTFLYTTLMGIAMRMG